MNLADFVARLAARTHPERAAAWDAVGLQVGDPAEEVRTTMVVHEVTEEVTEQAHQRTRRPRCLLPSLAVPSRVTAGARSKSVRTGDPPAPGRDRCRRHAQRLRRHARRHVRRDGRCPRPDRYRRVRSGETSRPGQDRDVRSRRLGGGDHRRPRRRLEPARSATTTSAPSRSTVSGGSGRAMQRIRRSVNPVGATPRLRCASR